MKKALILWALATAFLTSIPITAAASTLDIANAWIAERTFLLTGDVRLDGPDCRIEITRRQGSPHAGLQGLHVSVSRFNRETFRVEQGYFEGTTSDVCRLLTMTDHDLKLECTAHECEEQGCVDWPMTLTMLQEDPRLSTAGPGKLTVTANRGAFSQSCRYVEPEGPIWD